MIDTTPLKTYAVAVALMVAGLALVLTSCTARQSPPTSAQNPTPTSSSQGAMTGPAPGLDAKVTDAPFCNDPFRDVTRPCIVSK